MIIGITGTLGAGKGTIADFLKQKDFTYYSCSDYLRGELRKQGKEITIPNLAELGNSIRGQYGNGEIAKRLLEQIKEKNVIVDSLRHPDEIKSLKESGKFILIGIDANIEIRYERLQRRNKNEDRLSFLEFMQEEQKQKTNSGSTMQLNNCLDLADYKIENNGTFEELKQKLEKIFQEISVKEKYVRPTWDEYFMKITTVVAERATCLRHDIGAIIVKDKRIISTGYNGAAKGAEDCLKLGCRKDELSLASGMCSEDCRAIHAEQNAIIQAALHGVSTEGATLYCTTIPCRMCAKEIVNAGIKRVVTYSDYEGARGSIEYLRNLGVSFEKIARPNSTIKFKD